MARRLTADADVVFENFRPGVAEKLGIGYDDLAPANPGLVYCSISGFGRVGKYSGRPALDIILQAMTGVMDRQGNGGDPRLLVVTVADTYAAALAVQSVLAALLARSRDGQGQRVEVTLLEALIAAQGYRIISPAGEIMLSGDRRHLPVPGVRRLGRPVVRDRRRHARTTGRRCARRPA